jgi:predicted house-cleaning noncanonical NTP pyrophosphatase (MazG superfamily)
MREIMAGHEEHTDSPRVGSGLAKAYPAVIASWVCPDDLASDVTALGAKAVGLFKLPSVWVPRFLVLTSNFWALFKKTGTAAEVILKLPDEEKSLLANFLAGRFPEEGSRKHFLVRSNSVVEGLARRGSYETYVVEGSSAAVASAIDLLFSKAGPEAMCVILQAAIEPMLPGHMSNERRLTANKKRWLIEGLSRSDEIHQQFVHARAPADATALMAGNEKEVTNHLRSVAGRLLLLGDGVFHCEWVWSGKRLWIVQCDRDPLQPGDVVAEKYLRGSGSRGSRVRPSSAIKHFSEVDSDEWKKLRRPKEFARLGLPVADVYLLTGAAWRNAVGEASKRLREDLAEMCEHPVVVRFDISTRLSQEDLFLPTSPALKDPGELAAYMNQQAEVFRRDGIPDTDWAFLLAHLVPARASAMIHARPRAQRVRIDTLWGFPDGLLHFPHDTWFYHSDGRLTEHRNYKGLCLLPQGTGWRQCRIGSSFDWLPVLARKEVITLGKWGLTLAGALGTDVQLMALARIGGDRGPDACLPWHYTSWDVPSYKESLRVLPDPSQIDVITSREDLVAISRKRPSRSLRGYLIRPEESLLRDNQFLKDCAMFAAGRKRPIYFEGSLLGHAYYLMAQTGAVVIPVTGDEPAKDRRAYHKLVRDRIPVIIEKAGGLARVRHMPGSEALSLLAQKLIEEAFEVRSAVEEALIEELADVLEVVEAMSKQAGIDREALEQLRKEKRTKRGGFDKLIYLEETDVQPLKVHADAEGRLPLFASDISPTPGRGRSEERRIQAKTTANPQEVARFVLSLVPPLEKGIGGQVIAARVGDFRVEVRYQKSEAIVSILVEQNIDSPDQLTLFPDSEIHSADERK